MCWTSVKFEFSVSCLIAFLKGIVDEDIFSGIIALIPPIKDSSETFSGKPVFTVRDFRRGSSSFER